MNRRPHRHSVLVPGVVLAMGVLSAQGKARISILATGGTIAGAGDASGYGYKAGAFKVEDLALLTTRDPVRVQRIFNEY